MRNQICKRTCSFLCLSSVYYMPKDVSHCPRFIKCKQHNKLRGSECCICLILVKLLQKSHGNLCEDVIANECLVTSIVPQIQNSIKKPLSKFILSHSSSTTKNIPDWWNHLQPHHCVTSFAAYGSSFKILLLPRCATDLTLSMMY